MTMYEHLLPAQTAPRQVPQAPLANRVASLGTRIAGWITTAANYYTAAAVYEQLSGLSDAELQRRGLSRSALARDICAACDRAKL
jgi:hypothetical protein